MKVRVLLFASYAEVLGAPEVHVEVRDGATAHDILELVRARPGGDRLPPAPLIAVNQQYATATTRVIGTDEVAIIPPVAGG